MDKYELKAILEMHAKYWAGAEDGKLAYLKGADLHEMDLSGVDLSRANLSEANLSRANLSKANLYRANLSGANLSEANLSGANLSEAYCGSANLSEANLSGVDLHYAELHVANLHGANLSKADARCTCFIEADLTGANLSEIDLTEASLLYALADDGVLDQAMPLKCPEKGSFIGWKKAYTSHRNPVILKLLIPEDAKRSSATGYKCRCSKAKVIAAYYIACDPHGIYGLIPASARNKIMSSWDNTFVYCVGEIVEPVKAFNENRWIECASGIHFFMTKEEAIEYEG